MMGDAIINNSTISGHYVSGNYNTFYNTYTMSENISEVILSLANSQSKLAEAISESILKRSEADLIRAKTEKQIAENQASELRIREREADNNGKLINSIHETLIKINERLK